MYKTLILLVSVLLLSAVSTSQALVVGDFEEGLDGWAPSGEAVLTQSTIGASTGSGSLMIESAGSWQMLALLDIKSLRSILASDGAAVSADVTAFAEDMQTDWMNMEMIINAQNNDDNGANNNIGWQSLGGVDIVRDGVTQTLRWEVPAELSAKIAGTDDNIAWFELFIVTNNGAANTKIYVDNIQLIGAEPEPEPEEPSTKIIYVDATDGEAGNTTYATATGEVFAPTDPGTAGSGADGLWRKREGYANGGTIYESGGSWEADLNTEDCPRLVTSVDVPEGSYDVYVYFWADSAQWRIQASLENLEGDLPLFLANDPNSEAILAVADDFAEPVPMLAEGNRTLWQAYLGTTEVTSAIQVYIDDDPNHITGNSRTWYDGIGYKIAQPPGPKIIYVTSVKDLDQNGVQDDLSWVDWLEAEGYEVDARPGYWTDPLDANDIAELEAADLIIASRGMATDQYDGGETAKWNAITTPIICTNAWMIRTSRWIWMNSNSANKDAGAPSMQVLDPEHPIFSGIQTDQDGIVEVLDPNVASGHTSFLNDILDAGNGTLLAKSVPGVYDTAWIVEWPAGVEYFEGAGQIAGGPRILFMAGTQDDPYTVPDGNTAPVGVLNLNEAGKQMFLNAIKYLIPVKPVDPGTDGLVAYYALENDANDSSGNGLNGTIVGDPMFVEGAVGMGLQLDGIDDYVDLGNDPLFDLTEQVTLSIWVNTQDIGTTQNNPWLGKGDTSYMIKGHRVGNQIEFFIYDGTWITAHADVGAEFNGDWHHAAGTFDGEQLKIYVDGGLSVTADHVGGISPNTYNVAIGTNTQSSGRFSESIVDEAKIYNRALSEGEIRYLAGFRAPVDPGTDGLVAHYAFENDTTDSSGNGLDGTIVGDATFAEGVKGMALNLDGDDYVDCGGIDEFSFVDAMTLSTWVNIRSVTTAWMAIAAKGENAWRLAVSNETTALEYAFSGGTRGWQAATTATELAFDEWYHVAATYDTAVGATVYINGVADASNPDAGGIDTNQFPLLIGDNPEATGRLFDGMIDELMIYNRALSQEEILFLGQ
jgi:hypothetical protein